MADYHFPHDIEILVGSGQERQWNTIVTPVESGHTMRRRRWTRPQHAWNVTMRLSEIDEYRVNLLHRLMEGALGSFNFYDKIERRAEGLRVGIGDGSRTTWQLPFITSDFSTPSLNVYIDNEYTTAYSLGGTLNYIAAEADAECSGTMQGITAGGTATPSIDSVGRYRRNPAATDFSAIKIALSGNTGQAGVRMGAGAFISPLDIISGGAWVLPLQDIDELQVGFSFYSSGGVFELNSSWTTVDVSGYGVGANGNGEWAFVSVEGVQVPINSPSINEARLQMAHTTSADNEDWLVDDIQITKGDTAFRDWWPAQAGPIPIEFDTAPANGAIITVDAVDVMQGFTGRFDGDVHVWVQQFPDLFDVGKARIVEVFS